MYPRLIPSSRFSAKATSTCSENPASTCFAARPLVKGTCDSVCSDIFLLEKRIMKDEMNVKPAAATGGSGFVSLRM